MEPKTTILKIISNKKHYFQKMRSLFNRNRLTLCFQIAKTGEVDLLEKLLDRIPNPQLRKKKANSKDDLKLTPLHYAARYYHFHAMSFLIENGASECKFVLLVI